MAAMRKKRHTGNGSYREFYYSSYNPDTVTRLDTKVVRTQNAPTTYSMDYLYDKDILVCIFNYRMDENALRWKKIFNGVFDCVVLDSGNDKKNSEFIQYPNIYYSGLWNEAKKLSKEGGYKWQLIITSDILIDDSNAKKLIDRLNTIKKSTNLGVWSVLGDLTGHSNRFVYATINGETFRTFEGFFQLIRTSVLDKMDFIDTSVNLYGYSIDYLTCYISHLYGCINVVDEDIVIFHPKDKGYSESAAKEQSIKFINLMALKYPGYGVHVMDYDKKQSEFEHEIKYRNKKVLYTCVTGGYDTLSNIKKEDGWDYICFTNTDIENTNWELFRIPDELSHLSQIKIQRAIKLQPFKYLPQYDEIIWRDGNLKINCRLDTFVNEVSGGKDFNACFKNHPTSHCIFDEIDVCEEIKKDKSEMCNILREYYTSNNMPRKYGLYETGIYVYNNKPNNPLIPMFNMWVKEMLEKSHRDQLSQMYCVWKTNTKQYITEFDNDLYKKYVVRVNHNSNNMKVLNSGK